MVGVSTFLTIIYISSYYSANKKLNDWARKIWIQIFIIAVVVNVYTQYFFGYAYNSVLLFFFVIVPVFFSSIFICWATNGFIKEVNKGLEEELKLYYGVWLHNCTMIGFGSGNLMALFLSYFR